MRKALYYGDCLEILRKYFHEPCIDLVYLDPPFNSNRDYNVLFKEQTGAPAEAQVKAFTDTWKWSPDLFAEWDAFVDTCPNQPLVSLMQSFVQYLKRNDVTAYLARMTPRLYELHRVLKPTGSLYLHCDPAASHYLKVILDLIFGPTKFRSEIIWKRSHSHNSAKRYGPIHDVMLYYSKGDDYFWGDVRIDYADAYVGKFFKFDDKDGRGVYWTGDITGSGTRKGETGQVWRGFDVTAKGRHWMYPPSVLDTLDADKRVYWPKDAGWPKFKRYLAEARGVPLQDIFDDIFGLSTMGAVKDERLGYPTQKPLALLKRILGASSKPGDVVLDPFCGCGTTIMAAQELGRRWIGIDITATATSLIEARLFDSFGIKNGKNDYDIIGLPTAESEAIELANRDKHEFQKWAISLVPRAMPWQEKKGADAGVDGFVRFQFPTRTLKKGEVPGKTELVIISVKGGHSVGVDRVRELCEVVKDNKAAMGFMILLDPPTKPMVDWAGKQGFVDAPNGGPKVPKIQIRTVAQLIRQEAFVFPWNSTIHGMPKAGEAQRTMEL